MRNEKKGKERRERRENAKANPNSCDVQQIEGKLYGSGGVDERGCGREEIE